MMGIPNFFFVISPCESSSYRQPVMFSVRKIEGKPEEWGDTENFCLAEGMSLFLLFEILFFFFFLLTNHVSC